MIHRHLTYMVFALLFFCGGAAAAADCCQTDALKMCCCVDIEKLEVCTPQLCDSEQFREAQFLPGFPSDEFRYDVRSNVCVEMFLDSEVKPRKHVHPTVRPEEAPPPIFADLTLCFLPPPALS